jgi:hypothetical protein
MERRGLHMVHSGTEAHDLGRHVADDADTTQHQGFQIGHNHGRPPAVKKGQDGNRPATQRTEPFEEDGSKSPHQKD